MRYLIFILSLLPFISQAQNSGSVLKTGATNQATIQKGGNGADSAQILPVIDTVRGKAYLSSGASTLRQKGRIILDKNDSTKVYVYNGNKWQTVGGTTIDTNAYLKKSDTSRSGIVTTYFYVDSLYNTIGTHDSLVKYSDSNTVYVTQFGVDTAKENIRGEIADIPQVDTTSLSNRINTKIPYSDTGGAYFPTKFFLLNNYYINGGNSFGAAATIGTNDANYFALKANNTEALRIFSATRNIRVGGTTDNGDKLSVNGTIHATGSGGVGIRLDGSNAIRTNDLLYIDALSGVEGTILMRYGLGLGGNATFNNSGVSLMNGSINGVRLYGNYTANANTISEGIELYSYQDAGKYYNELRPTYYATAGTFTSYGWLVLGRVDNGVIIGTQYENGTDNALQVTGNGNITGTWNVGTTPEYADNAAAITGGLSVGTIYRTGDILKIVH